MKIAESLQIQGLAAALRSYTEIVDSSPGPSSPKRKRPRDPIAEVYLPQPQLVQPPNQILPKIEEAKSLFQVKDLIHSKQKL